MPGAQGFTYDFRYLRATTPEGTTWTGISSLDRTLSRESAMNAVLGICEGRPYAV